MPEDESSLPVAYVSGDPSCEFICVENGYPLTNIEKDARIHNVPQTRALVTNFVP